MITTTVTYAIVLSVIYVFSLYIVFKLKTKIKNEETKIYELILIVNFLGLLFHLGCEYVSYRYNALPEWISIPVLKLYLFHFFVFATLFLKYTLLIVYDKEKINNKTFNILHIISLIVVLIIVAIIPIFFNGRFSADVSFGGTSLIIICGVIIETIKQIESKMIVRNYTGFLNS